MTGPAGADRAAVRWLTAQSLVFGAMAALLGIVANAMFLDAYGSAWLPVTYIAIGVAGFAGLRRRSPAARSGSTSFGIAVVVLGGAAAAHRAPRGSSPRAETGRGCPRRCWCCSRS